ncbi:MAG TPA: glycosyltransferase family 4 protein [Polyangiaceae bacterium LLY-WYZ-15_(1-7)]|nr:glycosyltransferase family 4 protein [Polyangiaceae bacterium LLY-WYZ-15_(1-7)]HJL07545.1 glycosyltransferase family 4 protein [Polyangiaceae bacterium LLY-WYZ-15_(1-7)]HJL22405.1 glycosyltransferase family 4 protein [Polyangiaceae bacterium LLY-WYZ-15_(1-7)]HJL38768.1 glycosyltransferase family 4 protein [Polyangiaceae bacterium LLY-WYZ-15_(1-7)]
MHVTWIHDHAAFLGGAESYVFRTAERLRARGVRSTLLYRVDGAFDRRFLAPFDGAFPQVDVGRQVADLAPDVVYAQKASGRVLRAAARHARTLRFVHDHALFCLREHKYTLRGATCSRPLGAHCYARCGGLKRSEGFPGVRLVSLGGLQREQALHRRHAELVVGSLYLKRHAEAHGFAPRRVHHLPLPVDRAAPGAARRDPRRLLFVGALLRSKGLDVLLEALATRPALHLRVVGRGAQRDWVAGEVRRLGLGARVRLVGPRHGRALAQEYAEAGALVLPSRTPETFGLVAVEALAHGTPVVASAVGGVGEWLVPWRTGLAVPSNDAAALARALEVVEREPMRMASMGERGRALVRRTLSPERHLDGLLALFQAGRAAAAPRPEACSVPAEVL